MRLLSAAVVLAGALTWPNPAIAGEAPVYTLEERANAIAAPALLFIDVRLEGVMRIRATNAVVDSGPLVVHNRCSGFVVNSAGYAMTSTLCVRPTADTLRASAAVMAANGLIHDKKLAPDQKDTYIKELLNSADFTDGAGAASPTPKITAQPFTATAAAALTGSAAVAAEIVGAEPPTAGSVALLKLAQKGLPVVDLEPGVLAPGGSVTQIGYGTHDSDLDKATYVTRMKGSKIVGKGAVLYKLDSELGSFSHGGLVVDPSGRAIGMINIDPESKNRTNNLVADSAHLETLLATFGLSNSLQPTDTTYRSALDAYFGGRYGEAIAKLDQVLAAAPGHRTASAYRVQAAERLAVEGDPASAGMPKWLIFVLGAVGLVLVAVPALAVVLRRRRRRRRPAASFAPPLMSIPAPSAPAPAEQTSTELFAWPSEEGEQPAGQATPDPWAPTGEHPPTG